VNKVIKHVHNLNGMYWPTMWGIRFDFSGMHNNSVSIYYTPYNGAL